MFSESDLVGQNVTVLMPKVNLIITDKVC